MDAQVQTRGPGMSSEELAARIAKLRGGTEAKLADMNARANSSITTLQTRVSTNDGKVAERRQAARDRIANIDLGEIRKYVAQEETDTRDVIAALFQVVGDIDSGFKMTSEKNPEDDALMAAAQQDVVDAQNELDAANRRWLNWFGWRDKAIAAANKHIVDAKKGVGLAEIQVQNNIAERLRNGGFQMLFQQLTLMTRKTIDSLTLKIRANELTTKNVTEAKNQSVSEKVELTETLQALAAKLDELKATLQTKGADRDAIQVGTPDYEKAQQEVLAVEAEYRQTEEDHNTALVKVQRLATFVEDLGVQETALQNIHQSLVLSKTTLETDLPRRIRAYEASLEVKRGHSDLLIAEKITGVGSETDIRLAEESAAIAAAAARMILTQVQKAPQQIKDMQNVHASLIQALVPIMKGMDAEAQKAFINNGLDPNATSFMKYLGDSPIGGPEQQAAA